MNCLPFGTVPAAFGVGGHGDYHRDRDDAAALALLQVGCIEPDIGPVAFQRSFQEGVHALIDFLAELGDLALGDTAHPHGLYQVLDAAGRDAGNPGFLDDRGQRLLDRAAGLQEGREVGRPGAELRHLQLQGAKPGLQRPLAVAVAVRQPLGAALVPCRTDDVLHIGVHDPLQGGLGNGLQEIAVVALLNDLQNAHGVVGHRGLRGQARSRKLDLDQNNPGGHPPAPQAAALRYAKAPRAGSLGEIPPLPWARNAQEIAARQAAIRRELDEALQELRMLRARAAIGFESMEMRPSRRSTFPEWALLPLAWPGSTARRKLHRSRQSWWRCPALTVIRAS